MEDHSWLEVANRYWKDHFKKFRTLSFFYPTDASNQLFYEAEIQTITMMPEAMILYFSGPKGEYQLWKYGKKGLFFTLSPNDREHLVPLLFFRHMTDGKIEKEELHAVCSHIQSFNFPELRQLITKEHKSKKVSYYL